MNEKKRNKPKPGYDENGWPLCNAAWWWREVFLPVLILLAVIAFFVFTT